MKTTIMIPTYNEKENIGRLIGEILALKIPGSAKPGKQELHVLVVDDNSPDGTSEAVAEIAKKEPRVRLLTRKTDRGRGSAGIAGFRLALKDGADFVVEMDADFSHHPRYLPDLIKAAEQGADVVLGSRFVRGGQDTDRSFYRQSVTKFAGVYVRTMLGVRVKDVSSGYRLFRRQALEKIGLDNIISTGPSIILEVLFRCAVKKLKIVEVPIVFIDRRAGETKLNWQTLAKTLMMVARFRAMKHLKQL
ncbi:MAG: polyprenol monophosphomannose synthase [Deltaproteobacteria bacterium]|nr:polyprenol monophosphomannose synthase [Deltaproteobacteria bacterium]